MNDMKSIRFPSPVADEMVRAILEGRKTVTRRVVKQSSVDKFVLSQDNELLGSFDNRHPEWEVYPTIDDSPYRPGEILYVQERVAQPFLPESDEIHYYADYGDNNIVLRDGPYPDAIESKSVKWYSSASMPREAARLFLRVTDVRVERLQDITQYNAIWEGIDRSEIYRNGLFQEFSPEAIFRRMWDSTIKKPADRALYGWAANPWVWVIEFERCGPVRSE